MALCKQCSIAPHGSRLVPRLVRLPSLKGKYSRSFPLPSPLPM